MNRPLDPVVRIMKSRPSLHDIADLVMKSHDVVGLLVYGSYATGDPDTGSDVDLICVTKSEGTRHFMMHFGEVAIDIYAGSRPLLEQSIRADLRTNNNFVLDAFAHGRSLVTVDGSTEALISLAKAIWRAGPQQPGLSERQSIASAVQKAAVAAKRFAIKAEKSREWREIARIRLSYLFLEVVHAYCRVHRLWASSLWEMLEWSNYQYQDLIAMCRKYLCANRFEDQAAALADIAEVTISRISLPLRPEIFC